MDEERQADNTIYEVSPKIKEIDNKVDEVKGRIKSINDLEEKLINLNKTINKCCDILNQAIKGPNTYKEISSISDKNNLLLRKNSAILDEKIQTEKVKLRNLDDKREEIIKEYKDKIENPKEELKNETVE